MNSQNISGIYYQIPASVAASTTMLPSAKLVYAYLLFASQGGSKDAFPSEITIGAKVGLQYRQVRRVLTSLVSHGLVQSIRRGKKQSNVYRVTAPSEIESDGSCKTSHNTQSDGSSKTSSDGSCMTHSDGTSKTYPYEKKSVKEKTEKEGKEREGKIHTSDKTTTSAVGIVSEANNGVGVSVASTGVVLDVGRSFSVSEANTVPLLNESAAKLADAHKAVDILYRDAFGTKAKEARICDEVYLQAKYGRLDIFRHCQMLLSLSPSGLESYKAYIHYAIEFKRLNASYPIRPDLKIITQHTITDTPAATVARLAVSYAQTGKSWDWFGDYMRNAIAAAAGCGTGPGERYDSEDAGEAMWQRIKASMAAQAAQAKAGV